MEKLLKQTSLLVSETDEKGVIRYANEEFCAMAEYDVTELEGKPHNIIRHPDMPKAAFKDLWQTVKSGETWTGYVKNSTSTGGFYWVYAIVSTIEGGFISCRRKPSDSEIQEAQNLYKSMV